MKFDESAFWRRVPPSVACPTKATLLSAGESAPAEDTVLKDKRRSNLLLDGVRQAQVRLRAVILTRTARQRGRWADRLFF